MTKINKRLIAEGYEPNQVRRALQRLDHRAKNLAASGIPFNGSDVAAELKALKARIEAIENCIGNKLELEDGSGVLLKEDGGALLLEDCDLHQGDAFVEGAVLAYSTAAAVTVGAPGVASRLRNASNRATIRFLGVLVASLAASGAGGLDTGAEAAGTWYAVHVIGDSADVNAPAAMFSKSDTAPVLPAGYDLFRRIGWVRNNAASDIVKFHQLGSLRVRFVVYDTEASALIVLSAGSATAFTTVDCSGLVPPATKRFVAVHTEFTGQVAANVLMMRPGGSTATATVFSHIATSANKESSSYSDLVLDSLQRLEYKVTSALDKADIFLVRYADEL